MAPERKARCSGCLKEFKDHQAITSHLRQTRKPRCIAALQKIIQEAVEEAMGPPSDEDVAMNELEDDNDVVMDEPQDDYDKNEKE